MDPEKRKARSAHPFRKKMLRWALVSLLSVLFLEFVLYFGSNIFLSRFAQRKINEATGNVYLIDFNRFNFSLIRRGFFMDGIVMKPIHPESRKADQALFKITLDQIAFRGLWYSFFDRQFTIGKIYIDNPMVQLELPPKPPATVPSKGVQPNKPKDKKSPVKALEDEIKKTVQRLNLIGLLIEEVEINHANFFFFNFLSQNELKADNTSLMVRNMDFTTQGEWKTPFNAEGFEFQLEKASFPLPDGVHVLSADWVFISSLDNIIDIKNFQLTPDRTKESKSYYRVDLEELRVGNVDLNKAFMSSVLEIDELILNRPDLNVASNPKARSDSAASGDLNEFIRGNLNSVHIKELAINQAKFVKSQVQDTLKNRIELDELDFKMVNFYLGDDSLRKVNQFFYGEDAAMDIKGSRVYLGDQIHILTGEEVNVSSFKDELKVRNLSIQPLFGALLGADPEKLLKVDLPEFILGEADLKLLYNQGILHAADLIISKPQVEFTDFEKSASKSGNQVPVGEIIGDFLEEVAIQNFDIQEGMILFKNESGQRSNNLGFEKFSIQLENLHVRPTVSGVLQEQVQFDEIFLKLDNYRLKVKNDFHLILADQLTVDSKNQLLEVKNLSIKPENQSQIQVYLDEYGKTSALELTVPMFRAEGIDIKSAFYDEKLFVRQILLPGPVFSISAYREKSKTTESPESSDEVKNLLLGYFQAVAIDSVNLSNAQMRYKSLVQNKRSSFVEDNFSLKLKNFVLDRNAAEMTEKTLFSDEIDLVFNNYSFNLAGGKYEVTTDKLRYNSLGKTLVIDNLELLPKDGFPGRINLGLRFPKVNFKGVDIEEFLFENRLILDRLEIDRGNIELGIDRKIASLPKAEAKKNARKKSLEELRINTIETKNSKLAINYKSNETSLRSIETDFELLVKDFRLDSLIGATQNIGELYSEADLSLKDFMFALPDSVHTLRFSKVSIGTQKDQILFSDFSLTPKDHFGQPGNPVIEAKIDQLILKNNRLAEIQSTAKLDLREIRMINPKINVFLDSAKVEKQAKVVPSESKTSLIQDILLSDFFIENGALSLHRKGQGLIPRMDFQGVRFDVRDLNVNLLDQTQPLDLADLVRKKLEFGIKDYSQLTPDSLYKVTIGSLDFKDNNLVLDKIYYRPVGGNYSLQRNLPYQTTATTARVEEIRIINIDPQAYLEKKLIKADELIMQSPRIEMFRDKRFPIDSSAFKQMPQQMMQHANVDLDLISLRVREGELAYFEFAPKGLVPGRMLLDQINVDLAPFYLRKTGEVYPTEKVRLGIETHIMGVSKVNLDAVMYFSEKYPMDVQVSMDTFAFAEANDFLSKTMFVESVDGTVTDGNWGFMLNEEEAIGQMEFGYTDLKVRFLDSLTLERGMGKLKIFTFGANLFAKNSNPRSRSSKLVNRPIYQQRDKRKFVFNAWLKATFSGLKGTVGLGKAKVPKRREEESDE